MRRVIAGGMLAVFLAAGCGGASAPSAESTGDVRSSAQVSPGPATQPPDTGTPSPQSPSSQTPSNQSPNAQAPDTDAPSTAPTPVPVPYVPSIRPGSAAEYDALVSRLQPLVPDELRDQVPWPDLRVPDPIVAQAEIFDFWIWMAANLTEPELVAMMSAPGSPSREMVVGVFGRLQRENVFEERNGAPYRAFDHRVITFESADLPLWLARDVPDDAVVVYYSDDSGPIDLIDQDSGALLAVEPGFPPRTWLAIMVQTDVGWQLWRDQIIDPSDSELQVPEMPPVADDDARKPEL